MKKILLISVIMFLITTNSFTQALSGTKTIGSDPLDDYPTIVAAVTDLNTNGVGAGGVIFNVSADHSETISAPISLTVTSGSAANQIIFQKNGVGANPKITAYLGSNTPLSTVQDGIWNLIGCDYVTIDAIDLYDPNVTNPVTMEYGFGLFKTAGINACQNNTIKNCNICLNNQNNDNGSAITGAGSKGIFMTNTTVDDQQTELMPSSQNQANSYNKFYGNSIQKCNYGVYLYGYNAGLLYINAGDIYNEVGNITSSIGNTINNFGGATGATNDAAAIYARSQYYLTISHNLINNNIGMGGSNHTANLRGIQTVSTTGAFTHINQNNITIKGGGTTTFVGGIQNQSAGGNNGVVTISNNTITGEYFTATTGNFMGISNTAALTTLTINNNTISNIPYSNNPLSGSGTIYLIYNSHPSVGTTSVSGNTLSNITSLGNAAGYMYGIKLSGPNISIENNTLSALSVAGGGLDGSILGISLDGTASGTANINNNTIHTVNTLTGDIAGINISGNFSSETITGNIIHNFSDAPFGIYAILTQTTVTSKTISSNSIYNITSANSVYGIYSSGGAVSFHNNKVYNLQSNSSAGPDVQGISITTVTASSNNSVYNNIIGLLKAPNATTLMASTPTLIGLFISAPMGASNATYIVSYNTVFLNASSTGTDFGTAAFSSFSGATSILKLRNNIFVNKSTPNGFGKAVAYQRNNTTLTDYHSSSNNNVFYAGVPSSSRLIFYDETNALQTLANFQTYIAPRETSSLTEDVNFSSIVGADSDFLHINPSISTPINNGGVLIDGITIDFDGETRSGSTPDIGADEFSPSFAWTGSINSDWNTSGNWSWNGVPTAASDILIPTAAINPVVNEAIGSPAVCNNLTIEAGGILTINPAKALTVNGSLTNNGGTGGLIIKSTAAGTGSLIHNTSNVEATIEKYITGNPALSSNDYHLVSVPLNQNAVAGQFTGMFLFQFNPFTQAWEGMGSDEFQQLDIHQGYMVFNPNLFSTVFNVGMLNSGPFSTITFTDDANEFSMVPNPYPSAIDWDAVSGWTKTNLFNSFYIWDGANDNYKFWNGDGGGSGNAGSSKIAVGQAFFVEANAAFPVLAMNNNVRLHHEKEFYKQSNKNTQSTLQLNIVSNNGLSDDIFIRFSDLADVKKGFMDVSKLFGGETAPQLYSITGNNDKLSINSLNLSEQTTVIPLGLEHTQNVQLTFNASGIESFVSSSSVILEDKQLNKMIDLKTNPVYIFMHRTDDEINRFALHFHGVNATDELTTKEYSIWSTTDRVNINIATLNGQKATIELYDLVGRLVISQQVELATPTTLAVTQINGMAIVKVISGDQVYSQKVFIQ
ncbi:MAG: T9SS type A sorting domain-containing protein [Bacteroidales bacterium]